MAMASGDQEIVWPEHLFDGDHQSVEEDAVSQTSQGSDGIRRPSHKAARSSTSRDQLYPAETSAAREYWDHDTRDYASNRPPAALEDDSKWEHDKFDMLKIGPPPGLGANRPRQSASGQSGQQNSNGYDTQSNGRRSPGVIAAARFQHGQQQRASQSGNVGKVWTATAGNAGIPEQLQPSVGHSRSKVVQVPKLTPTEQHSLRQVKQRTDEMAAIMAQIGNQHGNKTGSSGQQSGAQQGQAKLYAQSMRPSQPHLASARPSMNHMFSGNKIPGGLQSPAGNKSASLQQPAQTMQKARKVLPITEPKKKQAPASVRAGAQPVPPPSKAVSGLQSAAQPRKHALAIVHPDSKAQILPAGSAPSTNANVSTPNTELKASKHLISIVDPKNRQPVQLPDSANKVTKQVPSSRQPAKRALQIVDPQNKEAIAVPSKLAQPSTSQLSRSISITSAQSSDHGTAGKRTLTIVDPHSKEAVQLPVRSDSLGSSHLHRSLSSISAASFNSAGPGKRTLTIMDPQNKEPVQVPAQQSMATKASKAQRKTLAIVDPHNKQPVALPSSGSLGSLNPAKSLQSGAASAADAAKEIEEQSGV